MDTEPHDPRERRRDELRRIVYGAPGEPPAGAVAELFTLEASLAAGDDGDGSARSERSAGIDTAAAQPVDAPPARRRVSRWGIAAALVAVAVGAAIVIGPARFTLSPPRGLEVFSRAPTDEERAVADDVVSAAQLRETSATALRSLGSLFGYEFWAYRAGDRVCLLSQREFWFAWVDECVSAEEFGRSGLTRSIPADDLRDGAGLRDLQADDVLLVRWGPRSTALEWWIASDP